MDLKYFNIPPPNVEIPKSEYDYNLVLCAYGKYDMEEIMLCICSVELVDFAYTDKYTYIFLDTFEITDSLFDYMDGFSPNLNKKLHIGHFSNLVYASAFKNMGICTKSIAIYGDTLDNTDLENTKYNKFRYSIDKEYYASKQVVNTISNPSLLVGGIGEYKDTKCFRLNTDEENNTLVGIKSDGSTSYFYQDAALIQKLNGSTLYLTGKEQSNHFKQLKSVIGLDNYSTNINHIGLGLISLQGEKMSSRKGNVIYMDDLLAMVNEEFDNTELAYNVLAGFILMSNPTKDLKINLDSITDPKQSLGLYFSYTLARLVNLPLKYLGPNPPIDLDIKFMHYKAMMNLNPSLLCNYLFKYCREVNNDYANLPAREHEELYYTHVVNIVYMLSKLGMYAISNI